MDYGDVIAAFFAAPASTEQPPAIRNASSARRLRDAVEPLAMHSVWCRPVHEAHSKHGLGFLASYAWSRAAALGEPDPGVVAATFAVFEPGRIGGIYEDARKAVSRERLLQERAEATAASLRSVLGEDQEQAAGEIADWLVEAVSAVSEVGRPIFAGLRRQPWPDDPFGRLWKACEAYREHRGDTHVAACISAGLDPIQMNLMTELWLDLPIGPYTATRGWSEEQIAGALDRLRGRGLVSGESLTEAGRAFREQIEATTDDGQSAVIAAIGDDLDRIIEQCEVWSARCVETKNFPPDPGKRAAG